MSTLVKTIYDTDYVEWVEQTAQLIRERRFDEIDIENLLEEVEGLAKSAQAGIRSQLKRLLMHLIKQRIQPQRDGASWRTSILSAQQEIHDYIADSPSLRRYAHRILDATYSNAVKLALSETGLAECRAKLDIPEQCPYTIGQLLSDDVVVMR